MVVKIKHIMLPFFIFKPLIDYVLVFLLFILKQTYESLEIYKFMCYVRLILEGFPIINPYEWPFSFLFALTDPYFDYWDTIFPCIHLKTSSFDLSKTIAIFLITFINYIILQLYMLLIIITRNKGL